MLTNNLMRSLIGAEKIPVWQFLLTGLKSLDEFFDKTLADLSNHPRESLFYRDHFGPKNFGTLIALIGFMDGNFAKG